MKAKGRIPKISGQPKPLPAPINPRDDGKLPEPPLEMRDIPMRPPDITQSEIVAFTNAHHVFRVARADFEAKRAALTMKLLQLCHCEEGDYFVTMTEDGNLLVEDRTSLNPVTRRLIISRDSMPSGGAA